MQPKLPTEIIDIIIDSIGSDAHEAPSRSTLRSLALVSAGLRARACSYLFHDLHLFLICANSTTNPGSLRGCERALTRLRDVLAASAGLPGVGMVHHIRTARISFVFEAKKDLERVFMLPQLCDVLHALHGVDYGITALKMEILDRPGGPITLKKRYPIHLSRRLNPHFYDALVALCRSQRLATLHLTNFAMYVKALCGTNIEELHLEQFMLDEEDEPRDTLMDRGSPESVMLQLKSMALVGVRHGNPTNPTKSPTKLLTKLAHCFHPLSPHPLIAVCESLLEPLVFHQLTHLTLTDTDHDTPLDLLPNLHTLKVQQDIFWMRRTLGFMTRLPQFFLPAPGTVRSLGPTEQLVIETDINFREIFLDDTEDVRLWDAWNAVDAHLTSPSRSGGDGTAGHVLRTVHFIFRFRVAPGRYLSYQQEPAFIARNRANLLERFPLLGATDAVKFSMDVLLDREVNFTEATVRCKGPGTG